MKLSALALAAAVTIGIAGAAPAAAQPGRHARVVVTQRTTVVHRAQAEGRHRGWYKKKVRVCRTTWRNQHRQRVCRWRYR
jgi:hypothetical protein